VYPLSPPQANGREVWRGYLSGNGTAFRVRIHIHKKQQITISLRL